MWWRWPSPKPHAWRAFNMPFSRSLWTTPTLVPQMPLINCYICQFDNSCRIICMLYNKSSGCMWLLYRYLLYFKCYLSAPSALLVDIALITVKWCDSWLKTCLRIKIKPAQKSMIIPGAFLLYYLTEKSCKNPLNRFKRSQIIILNGPPSPPIDIDLTVLTEPSHMSIWEYAYKLIHGHRSNSEIFLLMQFYF